MQMHFLRTERYKIGQMVEQLKRWHAGTLWYISTILHALCSA